jgi:uncharacterized protein (TIGR02118 family)
MIKVSVLYPNQVGARFDLEYYAGKHIPMVREKLGSSCKDLSFDQGISGVAPDSAPAYVVIAHALFDSVPSFRAAFGPHAQAILADIPKYTDIQPVIQVSEVRMA